MILRKSIYQGLKKIKGFYLINRIGPALSNAGQSFRVKFDFKSNIYMTRACESHDTI